MRPVLKGREGLSLGEICWRPSGWREPELGRKPRFSCLLLLLSFLPSFLPSFHSRLLLCARRCAAAITVPALAAGPKAGPALQPARTAVRAWRTFCDDGGVLLCSSNPVRLWST